MKRMQRGCVCWDPKCPGIAGEWFVAFAIAIIVAGLSGGWAVMMLLAQLSR